MKKLRMNLENCYGIKKLEAELDFECCKIHSIYAPNGFMKTSFAKTFNDISNNQDTKDAVYPERTTIRQIKNENGDDLLPENIFVIEPYNKDFNSEKTSLLLVNPVIKNQYDEALKNIDDKKEELIKKFKEISGLNGRTNTPETEINNIFNNKTIYEFVDEEYEYTSSIDAERLSRVRYTSLFNDKTITFLKSGKIKEEIKEYIEKYDDLVDSSPILCKTFNHTHAKNVQKNLVDNGFFSANHSVNLFNGESKDEITTEDDLKNKIEEEKKRIFSDAALEKKFDTIDNKLKNAELRALRDYLFDNQDLLIELSNIEKLQKDIFISYKQTNHDLVENLKNEYSQNKLIIENAISKAKEEKTEWEEVVSLFNKRFSVPFKMKIENQEDVILKGFSPRLAFEFSDNGQNKNIEKTSLLNILSQGEKRALYILNLLFEIRGRIKDNTKTLLIIDDIADSFDYKNKYAIIEYLDDVTSNQNIFTIFLTHNFDFHRTISSRLQIKRENRYIASKNENNLYIQKEKYQKNPFSYWKNHLNQQRFLVSSIPFVRNLAEYCGFEDEYNVLTSVLHIKNNSESIKIQNIENIFKNVLKDLPDTAFPNPDTKILDLISTIAEEIINEPNETAELESKIILSIGIRHLAESYMIEKINDENYVNNISKNQTLELYKKYIEIFPGDNQKGQILNEVNLMTPENIHLNSFMYEPILDMSPMNLKQLYKDLMNIDA